MKSLYQKTFPLLASLLLSASPCTVRAAIGDWKAYMAYHDVQDVQQAGKLLFVQASNGLYVYNQNDNSIQTFSKMDGLNDSKIQTIAYNPNAQRLLIIYANANMDIMNTASMEVTNLSAFYSYSTTSDKTVNDVYIHGNYAYLSCGFGIIKVNVAKAEISETYHLGFQVDWCTIKDNNIYAYSATNGQYSATLSANLLDKANWSHTGDYTAKPQEDKSELIQLAKTLNPGGPKYNYFWFMKFVNGQLYTGGGGFGHGVDAHRPGTVQVLKGDDWTIYEDEDITEKTGVTYLDINAVDVDPLDASHVFAGGRTGLYEFRDGKFIKHYNSNNSIITSNKGNINYEVIGGLKFDSEGNLWITNCSSSFSQSLIELTKDGQWVSHHRDALWDKNKSASLSSMEQLMFDSRGLLWFVNDYWVLPSSYCYQRTTDQLVSYTTFTNQDGIAMEGYPQCIAEDKDHNIWIGSTNKTFMLEAAKVGTETTEFTQIKVPRNDGTNTADYLLEGVSVAAVAIDGANRKWFGTRGDGVYLIDADNITQLQHFTQDNSKLLSNEIESIAINEQTGEVFFGTDQGLCSYMSDASATNDEMTKDNVYAYPNPVRPDYTGLITVMGLSMNADVKICTANGTLVNQGRSNGGTYTWDGRDLQGRQVASGVYMVQTATSDGKKGTVCKIAIVR